MPRRQRGVALITVLLVMSLALLVTGGLLRSHRLVLHSSGQHIHHLQLRQLSLAGEAWALQRVRALQPGLHGPVGLGQAWAREAPELLHEGGAIQVRLEDLAGRFNVNALTGPVPVDRLTAQRWQRLQSQLELPLVEADCLQGLQLIDISQLRQLPGVDAQWLKTLQPWLVLLPKDARLNINTAPANLLSMLEGVTPALARRLLEQRSGQGHASVQDFTFSPLLMGSGVHGMGLGVSSRWFRIVTDVRLGPSRLRLESDIERDLKSGRWKLLQRRFLAPTHSEPS